jgi:predicted lipoprotein with Yx(FWY)xxD motif
MKNPSVLAFPLLLLVGLFLIIFAKNPVPTAVVPSTATTTPAIPGDNLALGQDYGGPLGNYLFAYNGMTLYSYIRDERGVSNCTGACAITWPPYIVTSADNLVAESPIPGTVGTITRADGTLQLTYNGIPLYFYSGDTQSGDTLGYDVDGAWNVVSP